MVRSRLRDQHCARKKLLQTPTSSPLRTIVRGRAREDSGWRLILAVDHLHIVWITQDICGRARKGFGSANDTLQSARAAARLIAACCCNA